MAQTTIVITRKIIELLNQFNESLFTSENRIEFDYSYLYKDEESSNYIKTKNEENTLKTKSKRYVAVDFQTPVGSTNRSGFYSEDGTLPIQFSVPLDTNVENVTVLIETLKVFLSQKVGYEFIVKDNEGEVIEEESYGFSLQSSPQIRSSNPLLINSTNQIDIVLSVFYNIWDYRLLATDNIKFQLRARANNGEDPNDFYTGVGISNPEDTYGRDVENKPRLGQQVTKTIGGSSTNTAVLQITGPINNELIKLLTDIAFFKETAKVLELKIEFTEEIFYILRATIFSVTPVFTSGTYYKLVCQFQLDKLDD